ncbi:MAG: transcriptional regulator [Saprospiraceae bacterium]|nr:transcriptional regulator [Saprospiraceae bacterium]
MEYQEARGAFIQKWGEMGTKWGINKTMGQIHGLLLITPDQLCTDEIMKTLHISRGNVCMNLKSLTEWGLVYKDCKDGCRKEYYQAEKDMYQVFRRILIQRKREELDPLLHMMDEFGSVREKCPHSQEFCQVMKDIKFFSSKADATLDSLLKANPDWFVSSFLRMIR